MIQINVKLIQCSLKLSFKDTELVSKVKERIAQSQKLPVIRQRLEIISSESKKMVLRNEMMISEYLSFSQNGVLEMVCKDLGSQIGYNLLFYLEYCFPPLSVLGAYLAHRKHNNRYHSLLTFCILFHFGKRLLETKFVHIFSTASVPFKVLIRNCIHYWLIIGGILPLEIFVFRKMGLPVKLNKKQISLLASFFIFEFLNFLCHLKLRKLRKTKNSEGIVCISMERKVPSGFFFDYLIVPNYTFELLSWAAFSTFFKSYAATGFTLLSGAIMTQWGLQKKQRYLEMTDISEEEKNMLKNRWVIIPFLI